MTNPQHEALVEAGFRLGYQAAVNEKVEGGYYAPRHRPFEDMALLGSYTAIAALSATAATPSGEEVRLRAALEPFARQKTVVETLNNPERPPWFGYSPEARAKLIGEQREKHDAAILAARAALEPQAKDL